jgi:hypothetical protein
VYDAATIERAVRIAVDEGTTAARLATGISDPQIRRYVKRRGLRPFQPDRTRGVQPLPSLDGQESREDDLTETGWSINLKSRTVKTFDDLVKECGVNLKDWQADRFRCRSYQVSVAPRAVRPEDGINPETGKPYGWTRTTAEIETVTMYAVAASFKKKVPEIAAREAIEQMFADAKGRMPPAPLVFVPRHRSGLMLEPAIYDHHFNRLASGLETGHGNYDLDIAVSAYRQGVRGLLERSAHHRFEKVVMPLGHDLFNANDVTGKTVNGTPQDNNRRLVTVVRVVRQEIVAATDEMVANVGPVELVLVGGNHDTFLSQMLVEMIDCWYHDHPHVTVDARPTLRKYREWGRVMLAFTHGDKGKADRWAHLMATEQPAMWARTSFREVHTGHLHHERLHLNEISGVKVRTLPSLTAADAWHASEGFVGQLRQAQAFHWSAEDGLIGTVYHTLKDELPDAA